MTTTPLPHLLGTGTAGDLVAAAVTAHATGHWAPVRDLVHTMTDQPVEAHWDQVGLYVGAPAVAFALRVTGRFDKTRALSTLDAQVADIVEQRLIAAEARLATGRPPRMREYDLVRGLTGLGVSLRQSNARPDLLDAILHYLVRLLTEPLNLADGPAPGWWTSDGPTGEPDAEFPHGHGNLGLAHGVAGPLAFLAVTAREDRPVPGQLAAVESTAKTLIEAARPIGDSGVTGWQAISHRRVRGAAEAVAAERPSWCYGTPGIAFAIQQAGIASGNRSQQTWAETVLADALGDTAHLDLINDATICHGWAGAYLVADRAAFDAADDERLTEIANSMAARIHTASETDRHGLLTGPASVQLALSRTARNQPARDQFRATSAPVMDWRACLLLDLPGSTTP